MRGFTVNESQENYKNERWCIIHNDLIFPCFPLVSLQSKYRLTQKTLKHKQEISMQLKGSAIFCLAACSVLRFDYPAKTSFKNMIIHSSFGLPLFSNPNFCKM